jgi:hypothetical protein
VDSTSSQAYLKFVPRETDIDTGYGWPVYPCRGVPACCIFMKRFRFNLHSVKELRESRESAALEILGERLRAHAAAAAAAERSQARYAASQAALARPRASAAALTQADRDR